MLTVAIVLGALLLPVLVLAEIWRSRRVAVPADAPDTQIDPVLSTAGMSRKILLAMVALVEAFLLLVAYGANEPFRQQQAAARQLEFAEHNAAHTYVQYCLSCHGADGRGFLEIPTLPGKPLNTPDLQSTNEETRKANVKMIATTIRDGRGAIMPAWGVENGGPLNYEMINELVALITNGRWDMVRDTIRREAAAVPTEAPITDPVATGRTIVTQGACASCHAISGTQARGTIGPALDGIASRRIGGVLDFTRENIKRWVTNPPQQKPGSTMPPYQFDDRYLEAIASYLETLR
ncbi:MAG TPA: c-type cytochrome [Chloroflexota bacterium]|nr:c-type cytochrome [Chloroflexota bacterium]